MVHFNRGRIGTATAPELIVQNNAEATLFWTMSKPVYSGQRDDEHHERLGQLDSQCIE